MTNETQKELDIEKQMYIENLLAEGTTTQDGEFHFNLESAKFFILYFNTSKILGSPAISWRNINGEMVELPIDKAQEYVIEIIMTLKKVL